MSVFPAVNKIKITSLLSLHACIEPPPSFITSKQTGCINNNLLYARCCHLTFPKYFVRRVSEFNDHVIDLYTASDTEKFCNNKDNGNAGF